MEIARFEISKPNLNECKQQYTRMFKNIAGMSYHDVYIQIIDSALKKKLIREQFVELINLIGNMERLIEAKVIAAGKKGNPINISLPDIFLLPYIDNLIIYRPDALRDTINKIINYINSININSLIKDNVEINIVPVETFKVVFDMKKTIPSIKAEEIKTPDEFIDELKKILDKEMIIAEYIREIELYHCEVINHINKLYDSCKKMILALGV